MLFAGIDWSNHVLDYELRTAEGQALASGQVQNNATGLAELFGKLEAHAAPSQISIAFEATNVAWVLALSDRGYLLYSLNPAKGSRHNRGCAVDVTLVDAAGRELEMPTPFDSFTEAAHRNYQGGTQTSRQNRQLLQDAMHAEGFVGLKTEWWHFDAPDWNDYPILDVPLDQMP